MRYPCGPCTTCVPSRGGFTLLEILTAIWALGFVLLIGTAAIVGSIKIERAASSGSNRMMAQAALADQFRHDVGMAVDAPRTLLPIEASPTCLILRMGDGSHVVYRWENDHAERYEIADTGTVQKRLGNGSSCVDMKFVRTGPQERLVTMHLTESRGQPAIDRHKEISAALGGEHR